MDLSYYVPFLSRKVVASHIGGLELPFPAPQSEQH
jgi:hypothetical protein